MTTKPVKSADPYPKTALAQGNQFMRAGEYAEAIALYVEALQQIPALGNTIFFNLQLARQHYRSERQRINKASVAICGWELARPAANRIHTLAMLYETFADVEIIGSLFPDYGQDIWEPIRSTPFNLHSFIVQEESRFLVQAIRLVAAHPYDIVHLSKPRAPNFFFGMLYKLIWDAKVLMDIDEEELSFVGAESPISLDEYFQEHKKFPDLKDLAGKDWTRIAVGLAKEFDGITVSNPALQQRYGGETIRLARDDKFYNPSPEIKLNSRKKYGIPQHKKVVLSFGTQSEHKELVETAKAIASLNNPDILFCIVGNTADPILKNMLQLVNNCHTIFVPDPPVDTLSELMAIADCCVLLQENISPAAQFQIPLNLPDALGMGMVVITSETRSLEEIAKFGAIITCTATQLKATLRGVFDNSIDCLKISERASAYFSSQLSLNSCLPALKKLLEAAVRPVLEPQVGMKLFMEALTKQHDFMFREWRQENNPDTSRISNPLSDPSSKVKSVVTDKKLPKTVLVITWDVGHNPLGRSYMLAQVLDRVVRNVILVGFQFPRYGNDIWEPVRHEKLPIISLPGENLPEFLDSLDRMAQRMHPDIVIACKPRLPSILLGSLIKQKFGCPLIVDIDDHELSFFKNSAELTADALSLMSEGAASSQLEPYSELWTRLAQNMCEYADERIVSNKTLQNKFGGTVIPHVRDENAFDPALFDKAVSRKKYAIPQSDKVVMFFGTARHHKGIDILAEVIGNYADDAIRLVIVGSSTDHSVTSKLESLAPGKISYLPNQPFSLIPEIVVMADVVCLPQQEENPISQFQLPAKAIDAIAMGIPLLVARTPPLMELVQNGVANPIDRHNLPELLKDALNNNRLSLQRQNEIRHCFLNTYSYEAAANTLRKIIERSLRNRQPAPDLNLPALISEIRRVSCVAKPTIEVRQTGTDFVVFWKQNDTGLYGHRPDRVIQYLASRPDVRKVVVFDAPISEHEVGKHGILHGEINEDRQLYLKTYEKAFGKLDTHNISYNVFIYPPGIYSKSGDKIIRNLPNLIDPYIHFIKNVLEREGVQPKASVFWIYPKNFDACDLIARFTPARVVVDVVDDHRKWLDVSAEQCNQHTANYRETLALANMAFVNCATMLESMHPFFPAIRLVPNGCDDKVDYIPPRNDPEVTSALKADRLDNAKLQHYLDENSWKSRFSSHIDELLLPLKESANGS